MRSGSTTLAAFALSLLAVGCSANVAASEDSASEEVVSSASEALHASPLTKKLVGTYIADDARRLSLELREDGTFARDTGIRCITTPCPSHEIGAWELLRGYNRRGAFVGYVVHVAGPETNAFYMTRPNGTPVKLTGLAAFSTSGSYTKEEEEPVNPCIVTLCPFNTRCIADGDQARCEPLDAEPVNPCIFTLCAENTRCVNDGGVARCESPFTCPDATVAPGGYINCMPIVSAERAPLCSGDYHTWIQANCPGIEFTY